ncbi:hypothetical protein T484DRAFT_2771405 [Baffinella frigidus]|nr:hypothetical protein T484DRAFT_2771405 [Cryptophyta sp. CCMP2293]
MAAMAAGPGGKGSSFLQRFQNKISVVGKDGSHAKVGEPGRTTRPAHDLVEKGNEARPWRGAEPPRQSRAPDRDSLVPKQRSHSHGRSLSLAGGGGGGGGGGYGRAGKGGRDLSPPRQYGGGKGGRDLSPPRQYGRAREDSRDFGEKGGGLAYSKQARPVEYTPYSQRDYNAQYGAEYVELGKLGPDLDPDDLAEKRQRQERIKAYAEAVRHENKQLVAAAPEPRVKAKAPSKRDRAMEFAKRVPKPRPKKEAEEDEDEDEEEEEELTELQQLAQRHARDRALVDAIRKDLRL